MTDAFRWKKNFKLRAQKFWWESDIFLLLSVLQGISVSESMHRTSLLKNKLSTPYPLKIQFNGSKFGGPFTTPVIPTIRVGGLSAVNRGQGGVLRKKPTNNVEIQVRNIMYVGKSMKFFVLKLWDYVRILVLITALSRASRTYE